MKDFTARLCCFLAATTLAILPCLSVPPHLSVVARKNVAPGGGFTDPTDIASLEIWLDASDSSTLYDADTGGSLTGADGQVGRWEDKSGNGRNFVQATSTVRPLRRVAAINSLDAVQFDGSNDGMRYLAGLSLSNSYTMFFVVQRVTGTGYQVMFAVSSTHEIALQNNKTNFYIGSAKYSTATQSTATTYVIGVRANAGAIEFFLDGAADGTNTGATAQSWSALGYHGGGEYLNGYLCEVVVYSTALSNGDMDNVEAYLAAKWQP